MTSVIVGRELVDVSDAKCICCGHPFEWDVNVFTENGKKEIAISGMCEKCFDGLFEDMEE